MVTKINEYYKTHIYSGIPVVPPEEIEQASVQNNIKEDTDINENKRKIDGVFRGDFFSHHHLK